MSKVFYKMQMFADESGLAIFTREYHSIRETPCYHFCVASSDASFLCEALMRTGETKLQAAKRMNKKVHKISKDASRFAHETKDQAYQHLLFMKSRQLMHLKRDLAVTSHFLDVVKDKKFSDFKPQRNYNQQITIPDTHDFVHEHYRFD
jgi:hypothetical protein